MILEHREEVKSFEDRVVIYDHFGMKKDESLIKKVRFMVKAMDCKVIILDHISLVVSAMGDTNERVVLDKLMTDLRTLVSETGCCMHVVSHLSRGSKHDASHEEGGVIKLADLRGSHSIAQLADGVFALQGGEENMIKLVALKQRINGKTGKVCQLSYNPNTGRLAEVGVF
jgi:twinkle protein